MGPLRVHSHGRKIARSADLRPHITATPAWPRRRKRRGALGHWPLEPVTQASAGRSLLVAPWAASMPPESVPQGSRCMCFEHARRSLPSCAPTEPHPDTLTCCEPVQAVSDALPFYDFLAYLFAPSHMYNPFSSARRSDASGVLFHPGAGGFLQLEWPTTSCRRSGGQTTSLSSARSTGELPVRPAWCAA